MNNVMQRTMARLEDEKIRFRIEVCYTIQFLDEEDRKRGEAIVDEEENKKTASEANTDGLLERLEDEKIRFRIEACYTIRFLDEEDRKRGEAIVDEENKKTAGEVNADGLLDT